MAVVDHPELNLEEVSAIQEAIRDMENGDLGRNAKEVMAEIRAEFGIGKHRLIRQTKAAP